MSLPRLILITLILTFVFADRGLIPFNSNITIFEPNQRAMIAWNGSEEILLLSTDLRASDSTMVLEVLPLPSEPQVKKGELETFNRAVKLINQKIYIPKKRNGDQSDTKQIPPPAEITFHKQIGAHNISVVHLISADGFIQWVRDYLKLLKCEQNIISDQMENLIKEYINDKFVWFVFDVITLKNEPVTNEPIQYQFKSNTLFYPLKITSTNEGNTTIELLILTPRLLQNFSGLSIKDIKLAHDPITITDEELKYINQDMYELLKDYREMKLRIWNIKGELNSFKKDLLAR